MRYGRPDGSPSNSSVADARRRFPCLYNVEKHLCEQGNRRRNAMAEALYRKYRPQTFEDVVGQTHIERTLKTPSSPIRSAMRICFAAREARAKQPRLACWPRRFCASTVPRLLPTARVNSVLPSPRGAHPDVNELDAASRTGVENVREEIIGRVQFAPTRGRYKIYIIDEVHMLSTAAFNALLKTLEEPPSHVVFVLCTTTDPQKVPETIHSRCQRFDFHRRISNDEIVSRLGAVCAGRRSGVRRRCARPATAHRAQGGMRDAHLAQADHRVRREQVLGRCRARSLRRRRFQRRIWPTSMQALGRRDAATLISSIGWWRSSSNLKPDLAQFARELAQHVRNLRKPSLAGTGVALDQAHQTPSTQ